MAIAILGWGLATYIAFIIVAAVVVVLAGYLIAVASVLTKVSFTLGTVIIGVRAIAMQTEPVDAVVAGIASDVNAIQLALRDLLPSGVAVRRLPVKAINERSRSMRSRLSR